MDRSEKLPWQEAQKNIASLLKAKGFEVWEEKKLGEKRVDILSKRIVGDKTYYMIFEVKHYNSVPPSLEVKFEEQLVSYLLVLIKRELKKKSIKTLLEKYAFIGYLVMTKDYMLFKNRKINYRKPQIHFEEEKMKKLWKRNVYFFYSKPEYIKKNLEKIGLLSYKQTDIMDFLIDSRKGEKKNFV